MTALCTTLLHARPSSTGISEEGSPARAEGRSGRARRDGSILPSPNHLPLSSRPPSRLHVRRDARGKRPGPRGARPRPRDCRPLAQGRSSELPSETPSLPPSPACSPHLPLTAGAEEQRQRQPGGRSRCVSSLSSCSRFLALVVQGSGRAGRGAGWMASRATDAGSSLRLVLRLLARRGALPSSPTFRRRPYHAGRCSSGGVAGPFLALAISFPVCSRRSRH